VDRGHTVVPPALHVAEMLDHHSHEGNEKVMLLLSDGADCCEVRDDAGLGYEPQYRGREELIPNPRFLELVVQNSHGHFFR